ncbi:MAG: ImmA/IrrE family metallo-endopeptidase [Actinomycetota bacterium]
MADARAAERTRASASMEATRLHRDLGTTFDVPVDVLGIARSLGLVLMMQPLDNLLGFYVRGEQSSGIVINSQRPESLQRFTLAHEIGHHVLGHELSADDEHTLDHFDPDSLPEVAAQAFAASLLMPLPLVNKALRDLPATRQRRRLEPSDAYLFSRQLGVSYTAGVWALQRNRRLSLDDARTFIRRGALAAKNALIGEDPLSDPRADVWMLTAENNDLSVMCRIGDEIRVQLPEDTSSGLAWLVRSPATGGLFDSSPATQLIWSDDDIRVEETSDSDSNSGHGLAVEFPEPLEIVQDEHLSRQHPLDTETQFELFSDLAPETNDAFRTGGGVRSLTFVPREEGHSRVLLELSRPWDSEVPPQHRYQLDLRVRPKQLAGQGLFAPTAEVWVDEHVVGA